MEREEMKIKPRKQYTAEFKERAVKRVKDGQSITTVRKELGLGDQTLRNWIAAANEGKLVGAGSKVVTAEMMELSHLRAENARLKRENEIIKKAAAYFAKDVL
jgi:transposase